eukprot:5201282-Amphidinium_carterae.1
MSSLTERYGADRAGWPAFLVDRRKLTTPIRRETKWHLVWLGFCLNSLLLDIVLVHDGVFDEQLLEVPSNLDVSPPCPSALVRGSQH